MIKTGSRVLYKHDDERIWKGTIVAHVLNFLGVSYWQVKFDNGFEMTVPRSSIFFERNI